MTERPHRKAVLSPDRKTIIWENGSASWFFNLSESLCKENLPDEIVRQLNYFNELVGLGHIDGGELTSIHPSPITDDVFYGKSAPETIKFFFQFYVLEFLVRKNPKGYSLITPMS